MKFLVVGQGGREHAITHALAKHVDREQLFCAPGNTGTHDIATNVPIQASQIGGLVNFVQQKDIDLTIIGPEAPLVAGLANELRKVGRKVIGPNKNAAMLEGSKIHAKQFMRRHNIPTAEFRAFYNFNDLDHYLEVASYPLVIKADGLAGGKGVVICQDAEEARLVGEDFLLKSKHGEASERIVVENFLEGPEASVFCLTDGHTILMLPTAQDYKRAFDGDFGPNTGGMGAISPSPALDQETLRSIESKVLIPVIHGMQVEETPYQGFLYVGLILTKAGPRVLEFNVRLGDPETQAVLTRLQSDLSELLWACANGELDSVTPEWDPRSAVSVVLASDGYPEKPRTGVPIRIDCPNNDRRVLYHASTRKSAGKILTAGGRVFTLTTLGETLSEARQYAYESLQHVKFDGAFFRSDIGEDKASSEPTS